MVISRRQAKRISHDIVAHLRTKRNPYSRQKRPHTAYRTTGHRCCLASGGKRPATVFPSVARVISAQVVVGGRGDVAVNVNATGG